MRQALVLLGLLSLLVSASLGGRGLPALATDAPSATPAQL